MPALRQMKLHGNEDLMAPAQWARKDTLRAHLEALKAPAETEEPKAKKKKKKKKKGKKKGGEEEDEEPMALGDAGKGRARGGLGAARVVTPAELLRSALAAAAATALADRRADGEVAADGERGDASSGEGGVAEALGGSVGPEVADTWARTLRIAEQGGLGAQAMAAMERPVVDSADSQGKQPAAHTLRGPGLWSLVPDQSMLVDELRLLELSEEELDSAQAARGQPAQLAERRRE